MNPSRKSSLSSNRLSVEDIAVLVGHLGVTLGVDAFRGPLVDDLVGLEHAALIEELNRALGRYVFLSLS